MTNVTVERSMKTLGTIMTERRNRLGLLKVNEEMLIQSKHFEIKWIKDEKTWEFVCRIYQKMGKLYII